MSNTDFEPITYRKDLSKYLINRNGEVYSLNVGNTMKPQIDHAGYIRYNVKTDNGKITHIQAHIAVARQFIINDDPERKTQVNHIDEDKSNPAVWNLEWTTPKENYNHGTRNERIKKHKHKPVNEYDLDGNYIRTWASTRSIIEFYADYFGKNIDEMLSCESSIHGCLKGRSKSSMNRVWRYYEGNTDNIFVDHSGYMPIGCACSKRKTRFDFPVDIPSEYLYQKPSKSEIYEYFMSLDKLTDYEKELFQDYTS